MMYRWGRYIRSLWSPHLANISSFVPLLQEFQHQIPFSGIFRMKDRESRVLERREKSVTRFGKLCVTRPQIVTRNLVTLTLANMDFRTDKIRKSRLRTQDT